MRVDDVPCNPSNHWTPHRHHSCCLPPHPLLPLPAQTAPTAASAGGGRSLKLTLCVDRKCCKLFQNKIVLIYLFIWINLLFRHIGNKFVFYSFIIFARVYRWIALFACLHICYFTHLWQCLFIYSFITLAKVCTFVFILYYDFFFHLQEWRFVYFTHLCVYLLI